MFEKRFSSNRYLLDFLKIRWVPYRRYFMICLRYKSSAVSHIGFLLVEYQMNVKIQDAQIEFKIT